MEGHWIASTVGGGVAFVLGVWLLWARLLLRDRGIGIVVERACGPLDGGEPIVRFTTRDGEQIRFLADESTGAFGRDLSRPLRVRYDADRVRGLSTPERVVPQGVKLDPEAVKRLGRQYDPIPPGAVRIDSFSTCWAVPGVLIVGGLAAVTAAVLSALV